MDSTLGGLGVALVLFGIVLAIAWIIMPFAIIGTKPILRELLGAVRENNRLTSELQASLDRRDKTSAAIASGPPIGLIRSQ